ncbi:hypothetical protein [Marivirga harenae]|uniref:hypothetical protein n=1 Tax=Marivirga harenae TaxID=2010992 RepID=UPI0026E0319B|nr:hypothetical protein [Marivirga harenae]WKV11257.1 hypothetical protein Q3Y49_13680 [Marivirga harenae]
MTALAPKGLAFGFKYLINQHTYLKPEANAGETLCRSPSAAHHSAWQCGWYIKQQLFGLGAKKTTSFCFFTSLNA